MIAPEVPTIDEDGIPGFNVVSAKPERLPDWQHCSA
jgi:hypothetical protein